MIYVDDALAHGGAYALAAFLAVLGWGAAWGSALCLGLVGVGGAIEILQAALPTGHEGEWADMLANACGILGGWGAALLCPAAAGSIAFAGRRGPCREPWPHAACCLPGRTSVVKGRRWCGRVDLGVQRVIQKK